MTFLDKIRQKNFRIIKTKCDKASRYYKDLMNSTIYMYTDEFSQLVRRNVFMLPSSVKAHYPVMRMQNKNMFLQDAHDVDYMHLIELAPDLVLYNNFFQAEGREDLTASIFYGILDFSDRRSDAEINEVLQQHFGTSKYLLIKERNQPTDEEMQRQLKRDLDKLYADFVATSPDADFLENQIDLYEYLVAHEDEQRMAFEMQRNIRIGYLPEIIPELEIVMRADNAKKMLSIQRNVVMSAAFYVRASLLALNSKVSRIQWRSGNHVEIKHGPPRFDYHEVEIDHEYEQKYQQTGIEFAHTELQTRRGVRAHTVRGFWRSCVYKNCSQKGDELHDTYGHWVREQECRGNKELGWVHKDYKVVK